MVRMIYHIGLGVLGVIPYHAWYDTIPSRTALLITSSHPAASATKNISSATSPCLAHKVTPTHNSNKTPLMGYKKPSYCVLRVDCCTYLCRAHAFLWVSNQQAFDEVLRLAADRRPRVVMELVSAVLRVDKRQQQQQKQQQQ